MNLLAICIPNYGRELKLKKLLESIIVQIQDGQYEDRVSICISDDHSPVNPDDIVGSIINSNPGINIKYHRNERNMGMDHNFLNSVLISDAKYCWIVGNDDLIQKEGISDLVRILEGTPDVDIVVSPFDTVDENGKYVSTVWPLSNKTSHLYDTSRAEVRDELLLNVIHNSGLFGFLSNVIVKRENWVKRKDSFVDKMDSIFIQMYINIDTMMSGAKYLFTDHKLIINQTDAEVNRTIDRMCRILFGLDDVVEFFFDGDIKRHLKRILTDAYIVGELWELPDETDQKRRMLSVDSEKNDIYRNYYIPKADLKAKLSGQNVLIFGAGNYGIRTYDLGIDVGANIVGIADSSETKIGSDMKGFKIISPKRLMDEYNKTNAYVLVANHHNLPEMVGYLIDNKVGRIGVIV